MADNLPTVWDAHPHTFAKHAILRGYLDAWFPILSRQSAKMQKLSTAKTKNEILFIDAFAGPGEYKNGEPGSPIIALRAANEHKVGFPIPIRLLFVEKDTERHRNLTNVLQNEVQTRPLQNNILLDPPQHGDAANVLHGLLDGYEEQGVRFGPALAFMDQFGYSAVPMDLIARFMSYPQCEVFTYLDYAGMNRWIQDDTKADGFDRAFGDERWRPAKNMEQKDQGKFLLEKYLDALKKHGRCKYVYPFAMFDSDRNLLYWLIFCTRSIRGLEVMKKAMWKVDESGACRFSDSDDPGQLRLLDVEFSQEWLAGELRDKLADQEMMMTDVIEFVLTETPCYLFKRALAKLERDEKSGFKVTSAPPERTAGKFSDRFIRNIKVKFGPKQNLF